MRRRLQFRLHANERGSGKLEAVFLAALAVTLAAPLSAMVAFSSGRFAPSESDHARASTFVHGDTNDDARLIVIQRSNEQEENASVDEAGAIDDEGKDTAAWWSIPVQRTLSRILWGLTEILPSTRWIGRAHADATGQVESYDVFTASARRSIQESWDGMVTMLQVVPEQMWNDPSKVPELAGALAIGAVGSVLYPFQAAGAIVYGDDEEAGAVAGSYVLDVWIGKAMAVAGLGAYAVKARRGAKAAERMAEGAVAASRINKPSFLTRARVSLSSAWRGFVQKGDELAAALSPNRSQRLAHAAAMPGGNGELVPNTLLIKRTRRGGTSGPGGAIPRPGESPETGRLRAHLDHLGLKGDTIDLAVTSPTLQRVVLAARERQVFRNQGMLNYVKAHSPRWDGYLPHWHDSMKDREELVRLGRLVGGAGAVEYPGQYTPRASATRLYPHEFTAEALPVDVRRAGHGMATKLDVRDELLAAAHPGKRDELRRQIDESFGIGREDNAAYVGPNHRDRGLAETELGLLYFQRRSWTNLSSALYVIERKYADYWHTFGRDAPPARHAEYESSVKTVRDQLEVVRYLRRGDGSEAALRRAMRDAATPIPQADLARAHRLLYENGVVRKMELAERSPALIEDLDVLERAGWTFRRTDSRHADANVIPAAFGRPGQLYTSAGYHDRLAELARTAGTGVGRYRSVEVLSRTPMTLEQYVAANVREARVREAEGWLRSLEVRDELLRSLPDDPDALEVRQIHRAFDAGSEVEAIYEAYRNNVAQAGPVGRAAAVRIDVNARRTAQEEIANLQWRPTPDSAANRQVEWPNAEVFYRELYPLRRALMERWMFWSSP